MSDYPGLISNAEPVIKSYTYENPNPAIQIYDENYYYNYQEIQAECEFGGLYPRNCTYNVRTSYLLTPTIASGGPLVRYGKTEETYHSSSASGKTIYEYTGDISINGYPNPPTPPLDLSHRGGLLLKKTELKANGDTISILENTYDIIKKHEMTGFTAAFIVDEQCKDYTNSASLDAITFNTFSLVSEWVKQTSQTYTIFDESLTGTSARKLITQTNMHYESNEHTQLTKKEMIDSKGQIITTIYKYPQNYNANNNSPLGLAVNIMKSKNMMAIPIETTTILTKNNQNMVIGSSLFHYAVHGTNGIVPDKRFKLSIYNPITLSSFSSLSVNTSGDFTQDSRYTLEESVSKFNSRLQPIQFNDVTGISTGVLWGYGATHPVAMVSNAQVNLSAIGNEASYMGFESGRTISNNPDEDFWNFQGSTAISTDAYTGKFALVLNEGQNNIGPYKDFLPDNQTQKYIFSAWVKPEQGYVSGKASLTVQFFRSGNFQFITEQKVNIPVGSDWQYVSSLVDLAKVRSDFSIPANEKILIRCFTVNTDVNASIGLDELRFHPESSQMVTYTYSPYWMQPSSITDANGRPAYYEYDGLGRLQWVSDQDRQLVMGAKYPYYGTNNAFSLIEQVSIFRAGVSKSEVLNNSLSASEAHRDLTYYDGLGRPLQQVQMRRGPGTGTDDLEDWIVPMFYDNRGRNSRQYLPYAKKANFGNFSPNAIAEQAAFYSSASITNIARSNRPYAETRYEASPSSRVKEQGAPGDAWQLGANTMKMNYLLNGADEVRIWEVTDNYAYISPGFYPTASLYKQEMIDENGSKMMEFKDKMDRVVLKRVEFQSNQWLDTYYVYDDLNRLRAVFPPKMEAGNRTSYSTTELAELAFVYLYDERGRIIEKWVPGAGMEFMVYDRWDRLVLTQHANQRKINQWTYLKYDAENRPIVSGFYTNTQGRVSVQNLVSASAGRFETEAINRFGYTFNQSFPQLSSLPADNLVLSVTHYDHYRFLGLSGWDAQGLNYAFVPELGNTAFFTRTKGMVTGGKTLILGQSTHLNSVSYYDSKGRPIQSISEHQLTGTDRSSMRFDFSGLLLEDRRTHTGPQVVTLSRRILYDHARRPSKVFHRVNNQTERLLASYGYNAIGQLVTKNLDNNATATLQWLQDIDYRYNIRGWLTRINDAALSNSRDVFGMELNYDQPEQGGVAQYNGNISQMSWSHRRSQGATVSRHRYNLSYDKSNRLTLAAYAFGAGYTTRVNGYNEQVSYDKNGNITSLTRNAWLNNALTNIDQLSYSYMQGGNRLQHVRDNSNHQAGFHDRNTSNDDYDYDANGNLTEDKNKFIKRIDYNHLNLPQSISISFTETEIQPGDPLIDEINAQLGIIGISNPPKFLPPLVLPGGTTSQQVTYSYTISYLYDAAGRKLRKTVSGTNISTNTTNYIAGIQYLNNRIEFIAHEEGRYVPPSSGGTDGGIYHYFLQDHLGNNRVTIDRDGNGNPRVLQEDSYYPFGMSMPGLSFVSGQANNYLYNGKEFQPEIQLNLYDYGWRNYDPALGRWHNVDPMAGAYLGHSPYHFSGNNPLNNLEINGAFYNALQTQIEVRQQFKEKNILLEAGLLFQKFKTEITNFIDSYFGGKKLPKGEAFAGPLTIAKVDDSAVQNAQGGGGTDFSLAGMYGHFQVGGGSDYHINASSIDFSGTSQKQLGLTGMKPGDMRSVNLFKSGINSNSLAFGKVDMVYKGNNQFAIQPNMFDFNIEWQNGFTWRNAGTVLGGAVNYNLFPGTPFSPLVPLIFGGPYNVIFNGTTTIPR